jgi:sugar porter (SP) family MFS transporter
MNITTDGGLNWRLMLGSTSVAPVIVMSMIYFSPDTPRYYAKKGRYNKAFQSLKRLRWTELQAAQDLYLIHESVKEEATFTRGNPLAELFTVARNRRAALASFILMFMQQFCGVNVIMYYSSVIFKQAGISDQTAITASLGAGIINFLFALPAIKLIDTWGRRPLLLYTFPLMSAALFFTGFSFFATSEEVRLGLIATGIYAFMIFYSPGEGPIPFTYSAEAFPLHIRDIGMSFSTFVTWTFSFILALVFPAQLAAFTPVGAFCWYAGWCIIGFFLILFFVPETKGYTLEELDVVFSVPTRKHAAYQWRQAGRWVKKTIFRKEVTKEDLFALSNTEDLKEAQLDQAHAAGTNDAETSTNPSNKFNDEKGVEHEHVEEFSHN